MRKIISTLLSVFIFFGIIGFMPIFEEKVEAVTNGIYTYTILDDKATITRCSTSASGAIEIPSTLDGYLVTDIGYNAFYECHNLTTVTIPKSVTAIGSGAFWKCTSLKSVIIPSSITTIGSSAFKYCSGLTSITIPSSVTIIGDDAFCYCTWLNSVTIPNSVTIIGGGAFYYCCRLTSITIPNSVTTIGSGAFSYCSGLTSIAVPNIITTIGSRAFEYCSGLTSITIPNSVTTIGSYAFQYCSKLTAVSISSNVRRIEDGLFYYCSKLTSATIPNNVTYLGSNAFKYCSSLTSITIPNSVYYIGSNAFEHCSGLTSITIPNSVNFIASNAFAYCSNLTIIGVAGSYAETYANNNIIRFVATGVVGCYVAVQGITLNQNTTALTVGQTITLSPVFSPANASIIGGTWSSSNQFIATVSNGAVTAQSAGSATITYSCFTADRYFKAQCVVTVSSADYSGQKDVLRKLALSQFVYNQIDDSAYAGKTVSAYPADNSAMFTANGKDVPWSEFYSGTISNHKIIASSDNNNDFINYISSHLSTQDLRQFNFFNKADDINELAHNNGFYAAAFQDEKGNIIIAYRGTDDALKIGPDTLSDLAIRNNLMPSQLLSAKLFYDYIKSKYPSAAIQVTGHSLGGALADYVSMLYNIPSISFNSLTGLIISNTYLNQMDYITAFNGSDPDGWRFKRFLNSDDSDYAQKKYVLPLSKYTNNYIMQGNGYTNSIFSYSHMLQSMLNYNNGTFSIINGINLTPTNQPWKQGNLFLGTSGIDIVNPNVCYLQGQTYYTGAGDDTFYDASKNVTFFAIGAGNKTFSGGCGDDTYVIDANSVTSVTINDPAGNDKILLRGSDTISNISIGQQQNYYIINLAENIIKVGKSRDNSNPVIVQDFSGNTTPVEVNSKEQSLSLNLDNKLNLLQSASPAYTLKDIHINGIITVNVYDSTGTQLLGTYSNTSNKVEMADYGYFYSTNDTNGKSMDIDLINGNYILKVTSGGTVDFSVYDLGADVGQTSVYQQNGIDLSGGSQLVINSDFATAVNKFSVNNGGVIMPLNATQYNNAQQVTINKTDMTIAAGMYGAASATVSPVNVTNSAVTWSIIQPDGTSTASVVTNSDGTAMVYALNAGTAALRATAKDGSGVYAEIPITVTQADAPIITATADGASYTSDTFTSASAVTVSASIPSGFDTLYLGLNGSIAQGTSTTITNEGRTDVSAYAVNSATGEMTKTADCIVKIDRTAPVINGIAQGQAYYIDRFVTVSSAFINNVTVDQTASFTQDELYSGKWFSQPGSYSLTATDMVYNQTTTAFTIMPLPSITALTQDDLAIVQSIRTEFEQQKNALPTDRAAYFEEKISALEAKITDLLTGSEFSYGISGITVNAGNITVNTANYNGETANLPIMFVGLYDAQNRLIKVFKRNVAASTDIYSIDTEIPVAMTKVRVFLWNSLEGIQPMARVKEYVN